MFLNDASVWMRPQNLRSGCMPPPAPFLRHCLQNLVRYFKLAYAFSV